MQKMKGTLALVAAMSLAGGSMAAATAVEPVQESAVAAAAVAFQNHNQQIDFSTKINWGAGSKDKILNSSDSYKLGSNGIYYTRAIGNFSGGVTYPGFYEMRIGNQKTNTQTGNLQISISQGIVRIFVYSNDGKLLVGYSDTKTMKYMKDGQKYTVTIPQAVRNDMQKKAGIQIQSLEVTAKTSTYQGKTDTVCWTPNATIANNINLTSSTGVAKIGNTFVLPYTLVKKEANGTDSFAVTASVQQKSVSAADQNSYVHGPVLKRFATGGGRSSYYFGDEHPQQIHANYTSSGVGGAEFYSKSAQRNALTIISKTSTGVVKTQKPTATTSALGTFDIGCNNFPALPGRALSVLNSSGKQINQKVSYFTDVPSNYQFYNEINWLAASGIANGYSDGTFRSWNGIERGAVAAFFYRMAGSPSYTPPKVSPFSDVPTNHQFYKEISWLASSGITTGFTDGTFRPGDIVNRDAMAAFFYRFAGKPAYTAPRTSPFKDVATNRQFYKEISWVASKKISTGWAVTGGADFRPGVSITRDAMAAFIYRYNTNVSALPKK